MQKAGSVRLSKSPSAAQQASSKVNGFKQEHQLYYPFRISIPLFLSHRETTVGKYHCVKILPNGGGRSSERAYA